MIKRVGLTFLAFLVAAGAYVAWEGPGFLVETASDVLRKAGLPRIDFTVSRITLNDVTLEGIRVGGDALEIPRLSAVFTWQELFDAEVGALSIDGLRLTARVTPAGISFGELDAFFFADRAGGTGMATNKPLDWPFRQLILRDATIEILEGDAIRLILTVDGGVSRQPDGGLTIGPARIDAANDDLDFTAAVTATIDSTGLLAAEMDLEDGAFNHHGVTGRALSGDLSATLPLQNPSAAEVTGVLDISLDELPFGLTPHAGLTLTYSQGFLLTDLTVRDVDTGLSAEIQTTADLSAEPAGQTVALDASFAAADASKFPEGILPIRFAAGEAHARILADAPLDRLQRIAQAEDLANLLQSAPDIHISLRGSGLESPLFPGRLSLSSSLSLSPSADGSLSLSLVDPATLHLAPTDSAAWNALRGVVRQDGPTGPVILTVSETGPPFLSVQHAGTDADVRLAGLLTVEGGGLPAIDGTISARAELNGEDGIKRVYLDSVDLRTPAASVQGFDLSNLSISLDGGGAIEASEGSLLLSTRIDARPGSQFSLSGGHLKLPITWLVENGRARLEGGPCPAIGFQRAVYGETVFQAPQARFCLTPFRAQAGPLENGDRAVTLEAGLRHREGPILVDLPGEHRLKVDAGSNSLTISASGNQDGLNRFKAALSLDTVLVPTAPVEFTSIEIRASKSEADGDMAVEGRSGLRDLARPNRFGPIDLSTDATLSQTGRIEAQGVATIATDLLTLEWNAESNLADGTGRATARLLPFRFNERDTRLIGVAPFLKPHVRSASGQLLAALSGDWSDGTGCGKADLLIRGMRADLTGRSPLPAAGILNAAQIGLSGSACLTGGKIARQRGQILVENMGVSTEQVAAKAVNAVIDLHSFAPLRTAPRQLLSIGVVDVGFPLTDGIAEFDARNVDELALHRLGFDWAGGTVGIDPIAVSLDEPPKRLDLRLDGIQIGELTKLLPDAGITGYGILNGSIPLYFADDGPAVKGGFLASDSGVIRYSPKTEVTGEPSVVDDALSNLQYSVLRLDVEGGLRGGAAIALHLEGRNPDYYDGVPVVLDLNLTGPLGTMMNDGLAAYRVPDQIIDRMQRFGQFE